MRETFQGRSGSSSVQGSRDIWSGETWSFGSSVLDEFSDGKTSRAGVEYIDSMHAYLCCDDGGWV